MFVVVKRINNEIIASLEYKVTPDVIEKVECNNWQEASEVALLWGTYQYMNKTVSLKDVLSQVREPNYPGASEIEAEYTRNVAKKASKFGNDSDPPYQRPDRN